jgi:hypothetical protein
MVQGLGKTSRTLSNFRLVFFYVRWFLSSGLLRPLRPTDFVTPLPDADQITCHYNTVRCDTTSGLGLSFGADSPVLGICAYTIVRLVAQYCGYPDIPCWELYYVDHPGRNDNDDRKTDTVGVHEEKPKPLIRVATARC